MHIRTLVYYMYWYKEYLISFEAIFTDFLAQEMLSSQLAFNNSGGAPIVCAAQQSIVNHTTTTMANIRSNDKTSNVSDSLSVLESFEHIDPDGEEVKQAKEEVATNGGSGLGKFPLQAVNKTKAVNVVVDQRETGKRPRSPILDPQVEYKLFNLCSYRYTHV